MFKSITNSTILLCACLLLTGCWESTSVTFHQPGMYLGAADTLTTDTAELEKRFAGQQDR
jgi:hypothetical protein